MPIMEASFGSLGRSGQTRYIPSSMFLSLPLCLCHSPSLCHSVSPPALSSVPPHRWLVRGRGGPTETGYAVCQPAADVPGGAPLSAEVSNKESLGPGTGGQAVSLSALGVTPPLLLRWCLPVPSPSRYLTPLSLSSSAGKLCPKNKKKLSNNTTPSTPNKLLSPVFPFYVAPPSSIRELKGDKEEPVCVVSRER